MSFLLTCPHCGPRPVEEFAYRGEILTRPKEKPTYRELGEYIYISDNVAGVQREWWAHRSGARCGSSPSATRAPTRC